MGAPKRLVGAVAAVVALALMSGAPRAEDYPSGRSASWSASSWCSGRRHPAGPDGPHEPKSRPQLVVENRPGAGSSLGAEYVARAPKDGYTLLMCTVAQTINPAMNNLSFDFGQGPRADRAGRQRAADAGGASVAAGE